MSLSHTKIIGLELLERLLALGPTVSIMCSQNKTTPRDARLQHATARPSLLFQNPVLCVRLHVRGKNERR
jgi:hypothetical protein